MVNRRHSLGRATKFEKILNASSEILAQLFNEKFSKADDGECWPWQGSMSQNGYGLFHLYGVQLAAHRISYIVHVGPIPDGLVIDHLCRNRGCVNP